MGKNIIALTCDNPNCKEYGKRQKIESAGLFISYPCPVCRSDGKNIKIVERDIDQVITENVEKESAVIISRNLKKKVGKMFKPGKKI